jgi:hypothetical protein
MAVDMPAGDDISVLTDWVEIRVAGSGADVPLPQLDRLLRAEGTELADEELLLDEDHDSDGPADIEVQLEPESAAAAEVDVRVEQVRSEITDRESIGRNVYPFTVQDDRVQRREACGEDVYLLLLVLGTSKLPYRLEKRANEVEETYDLIALAALKRFLGRDATGVRFARTSTTAEQHEEDDDPLRRPTGFAAAIDWVRGLLDAGPGVRPDNEPDTVPHWETAEGTLPAGRTPLTSYNDAGVDVVVWWRFADQRAGFPVVLAQCTVQIAWEQKVDDIKLVLWEKWIDFDTVPPQKVLVIPFADRRDHPLWQDRTASAGVILDRVRLIELLGELGCDELSALTDQRVRDWTASELRAAA